MELKLILKRMLIALTGVFFAAYSAYNVFIIFRDAATLSLEGKFISAVIALLFTILAGFIWTAEITDVRFFVIRVIRRTLLIIVLFTLFALKLRMLLQVIEYLESSQPNTTLYGFSYFMTLTALLILCVYYTFIRKNPISYSLAPILLPLFAMILFMGCLVLEAILFFEYNIIVEASPLRTVVMRPVFYLGFIGLCAYFLFPPQAPQTAKQRSKTDETE